MSKYQTAGKGMYFLFAGEILALLAFVPFIGNAASLAGGLLSIYGLYTMAKADEGYKQALMFMAANVILEIAAALLLKNTGFVAFLVSAAIMVINAMAIYQICNTTGQLLKGFDDRVAQMGEIIWKTVFFCTAIELVCTILALIPIVNILAVVVVVMIGVVQLVIGILYLIFLYRSQKALKNCVM